MLSHCTKNIHERNQYMNHSIICVLTSSSIHTVQLFTMITLNIYIRTARSAVILTAGFCIISSVYLFTLSSL